MTMQTTMRGGGSWRSALGAARSLATSRWGLLAIAAVAIGGGLAANWGWMVAIGAAPLIIGLLPCAVMCALGICMPMMMGGPKKKALIIDATANRNALADLTAHAALPVSSVAGSPEPVLEPAGTDTRN